MPVISARCPATIRSDLGNATRVVPPVDAAAVNEIDLRSSATCNLSEKHSRTVGANDVILIFIVCHLLTPVDLHRVIFVNVFICFVALLLLHLGQFSAIAIRLLCYLRPEFLFGFRRIIDRVRQICTQRQ